jgi:hypothetical protein
MIKGEMLMSAGRWRIELVRQVYVIYYDNTCYFCSLEWREALAEYKRLSAQNVAASQNAA